MGKVFLSVVILVSANIGHAWEKITDCNQSQAVIDRVNKGFHGTFFQLVIRDSGVVQHFLQTTAVRANRVNDKGELILPLSESRHSHPSLEFVGNADAFQNDGRIYDVKFAGNGLLVEAFSTTQPTGGLFVRQRKIADWFFESCTRP